MEIANLIVQVLILLGLIWYALETLRIRRVSQEQNEITQKPCLVLECRERDYDRAVLSKDTLDAGERILTGVKPHPTYVALRNIGNGHAFNVRYELQQQQKERKGYDLPYIFRQESVPIYLSLNCLYPLEGCEYSELTLSYESLSRRRYESKIRIHDDGRELVMRDFQFSEMGV